MIEFEEIKYMECDPHNALINQKKRIFLIRKNELAN